MTELKFKKVSLVKRETSNYDVLVEANYNGLELELSLSQSTNLQESLADAKEAINQLVVSFGLVKSQETIKFLDVKSIDPLDDVYVEVVVPIMPDKVIETELVISPFDPEPLLKRIFNIVKATLGGDRDAAGTWMLEYAKGTGFNNPRELHRDALQVMLEVVTKLKPTTKQPSDDFVLEEKPKTQLPPQIVETKKSEPTTASLDSSLSIDEQINLFILNPDLSGEQIEALMVIAQDTGYAQSLDETPAKEKQATFTRMHDLMLRWGIELL